ncbi:hypothetical protein [Candidatus Contubernalis alkaliaceticus]|uniref:hypothetical protein n=1 Tax=Candidatus Contubernalis alkaliaceticus TaxID=338645 RepID=UPI001F4C1523|nr:hypothetical protein [Candidatus Contubernalis alkalaceticus]UNC92713.1 hypothetical protein HUE98_11770 [Candidatus Contubernalis alkalaceticus]
MIGDGCIFSVEQQYQDVDLFTIPHFDKVLVGWNVRLKVVVNQENYSKLKLALPMLKHVEQGMDNWLTDEQLFKRGRNFAKTIHVRPQDADSLKYDVLIYRGFPVSSYERKYGKEISKYEVEFIALAKGLETDISNYFRIGLEPIGSIDGGSYVEYNGELYQKLTGENSRVIETEFDGEGVWSDATSRPLKAELEGGVWTNELRELDETAYWTRSVAGADGWYVSTTGSFSNDVKSTVYSIRKSLSLPGVLGIISGDGTEENPFVVG